MFDAKKILKTINNRKSGQKIFLLGASVATLVATGDPAPAGGGNTGGGNNGGGQGGSTPLGATGFTLGDAIGNATAAIDHIRTGVDGGYVDAGAGADFLEGGSGVDYFRGAAGIDKILGGDGVDNLVLIGENLSQNLSLADITNANGTGVDLSKLLNLPDIIGQAVSDIGLGEIIDGGALGALLFAYGDLDLTQLETLVNITSIQALGGDIKISAKQLKDLIDGGEFEALIGDGSVKLTITNDGVEIDVDFGQINLAKIIGLDIADGVTLSLDQADLLGILSILGAGKIKGASGELDLTGIEVAAGINVVTESTAQIIAAGAYDKVGGEFLVNLSENLNQVATVHPGDQTTPQAVGLSNGNYAIAYNSNQNDIDNEIAGRSILVKLYSEAGAQLNYNGVSKTGIIPSSMTDLNDGKYVLTYTENAAQIIGPFANDVRVYNYGEDGFGHGNFEGGKSVSSPTKVSTALRNIEASHADITGLLDGGYAVAWHSTETEGDDTSNAGIRMRTYDADGIQTTTPPK